MKRRSTVGQRSDLFSEFKDLWHNLKVPPDADLLKALSSGMYATSVAYTG